MKERTHSSVQNIQSRFIPNLTTNLGRSLTMANWREVGTHTAAFDLTSLLMKPGPELLNQLQGLAAFTGWKGQIALNATMPKINREGECTLRSVYDGSRARYSIDDILMFITKLNPHLVILPSGINQLDKQAWLSLPETILPFFYPDDLPVSQNLRPHGIYLHYDIKTPFENVLMLIDKYNDLPCYVNGDLNLSRMKMLADKDVDYIESDFPVQDACLGNVYVENQSISLSNAVKAVTFSVIDEACICPTCKQNLTQAYLCHLLEHTPLLAQRFLIQHNIQYCHSSFTSA